MNVGRLALAAVVATVVDAVYGFLVYGMLLTSQFAKYPGVYRSADDTSHLPALFLGVLVAMFAASFVYAKGYEGGSGIPEGMRFGALVGLFVVGYVVAVNYATLNIGRRISLLMAVAAVVEWLIVGSVIGGIYKPSPSGATARRTTGV
jgi:hypothetical protein